MFHRAVFLDRDGTINIEKDYLHKIEEFEFIPGAEESIGRLNRAGFKTIVVSNQSGVARGLFGVTSIHQIHDYLQRELRKKGAWIDAFFYCPHHPDGTIPEFSIVCDCRKPNVGMVQRALKKWDLDMEKSYVIGDHGSDMVLGKNIGATTIFVRTGHGHHEEERLKETGITPDCVAPSIVEAVDFIFSRI